MAFGLKLPGTDIVKVPNPAGGSATNLSRSLAPTTVVINSSTGTGATIPAADATNAGVMTKAMFDKLAGIETAANVTDLTNVGAALASASAKATIVDADKFTILDSAASFAPKTTLWSLIKSTLKTHFDTFYATLAQANATHTGDATGATALTLATVNSNVGSFTNANVTVNAKGLVTAISNGSAGGTISTPKVYYVEATGNDGTGVVGNPSLPYATVNAAYAAGVTAAVDFCLSLGVGAGFTLSLTSDMSTYLRQVIGRGLNLTSLTISGTPADAEYGINGYNSDCHYALLYLIINTPGGNATGGAVEPGGNGALAIVHGTDVRVYAILNGGSSADGDGGVGGELRLYGQITLYNIDLAGGSAGPSGTSGSNGNLEADGANLRNCIYTSGISNSYLGRCSYTAADLTPTSALACATY